MDDRQYKIYLLKMVAQNALPLSFLECSVFRDVIRNVSKNLEVEHLIIEEQENVDNVCATADFWSIHEK